MILVNRFINIGVLLFVYCILCFSITFTRVILKDKAVKILIILLFIPLLELVVYDPVVYKTIYLFLFDREKYLISFKLFNTIIYLFNHFTAIANISYLIGAISIFWYNSYLQRNYYFLKYQAVFILVAMSSIVVPYMMIFSWAPKVMVNISAIAETTKFIRINLSQNRIIYNIFPYVVICVFLMAIFSVYNLRKLDIAYKNRTIQISSIIDAANISTRVFTHSMKNQLISILGDAEYLQDEYENAAEVQRTAENIISTVNQTIDRLNELHKHFDTIVIRLEPLELYKPLDEALNGQSRIPYHISLIKDYESSALLCLMDLGHMTECICVMINNAVEAIKSENGSITVSLQKLGSWGIISIADTGAGIEEKDINKIFTPFFSTKSSRLNWGIGLSYVHKIVLAHKGKIVVESTPGAGTIFKVFLPLIQQG